SQDPREIREAGHRSRRVRHHSRNRDRLEGQHLHGGTTRSPGSEIHTEIRRRRMQTGDPATYARNARFVSDLASPVRESACWTWAAVTAYSRRNSRILDAR